MDSSAVLTSSPGTAPAGATGCSAGAGTSSGSSTWCITGRKRTASAKAATPTATSIIVMMPSAMEGT